VLSHSGVLKIQLQTSSKHIIIVSFSCSARLGHAGAVSDMPGMVAPGFGARARGGHAGPCWGPCWAILGHAGTMLSHAGVLKIWILTPSTHVTTLNGSFSACWAMVKRSPGVPGHAGARLWVVLGPCWIMLGPMLAHAGAC